MLQAPGSAHKLNYLQHREDKVTADLALIASLLSASRQNNTVGDMGATYNMQASMKATGKDVTAKMAATSMLKRTMRPKCRRLFEYAACPVCLCVVNGSPCIKCASQCGWCPFTPARCLCVLDSHLY